MLVSYLHNLIYIKRQKVAGTSIAMFLQKACGLREEIAEPTHAIIDENGIVGFRGNQKDQKKLSGDEGWYNHIHAKELRIELGQVDPAIGTRSTKAAAIRNPFDQVVSHFHWWNKRHKLDMSEDFNVVKQAFKKFTLNRIVQLTDPHMTIDGENVIDNVIWFEKIMGDLENLCDKMGVTFDANNMPVTKSTAKLRKAIPVFEFFDTQTIDHMHKTKPWIFNQYDYADVPAGYEQS